MKRFTIATLCVLLATVAVDARPTKYSPNADSTWWDSSKTVGGAVTIRFSDNPSSDDSQILGLDTLGVNVLTWTGMRDSVGLVIGDSTAASKVAGLRDSIGTVVTDSVFSAAVFRDSVGAVVADSVAVSGVFNGTIGATTPAAGTFTTLDATTSFDLTNTQNAETFSRITNANAGTGATATLYVRNDANDNSSLFAEVMGTGYTTAGGFIQDAGVLGTGTLLSGGLSIMTRATATAISFYTSGHTNLRGQITDTGLNSMAIGATTPAAGAFTTFTSNGIDDNADATAITIASDETIIHTTAATAVAPHLIERTVANSSAQNAPYLGLLVRNSGDPGAAIGLAGVAFQSKYNATYQYGYISQEAYGTGNGEARIHLGGFQGATYANLFTLDVASGNVGIGVTPSYPLHVVAAQGKCYITSSTGTNSTPYYSINTGGSSIFGSEGSVPNLFAGTTAYATVVGSAGATDLQFGTNSVIRATIDADGDAVFAGTITAQDATVNVVRASTGIMPDANDGAYLGKADSSFSDLFLASGGEINANNGASTITAGAGTWTFGGTNGNSMTLGGGTYPLSITPTQSSGAYTVWINPTFDGLNQAGGALSARPAYTESINAASNVVDILPTVSAGKTVASLTSLYIYNPTVAGTATIVRGLVIDDLTTGATNYNYVGNPGIQFGALSTNNQLSAASAGGGTAALYIGNASITVSSDLRAKKNLAPFSRSAMGILSQANVVEFEYDKEAIGDTGSDYGPSSRGAYVGLIAQDMIKWAPWAINAGNAADCPACSIGQPCEKHDHIWKAEYPHLVPLMIRGMQEQQTRIDSLEGEIRSQDVVIVDLLKRVEALEAK